MDGWLSAYADLSASLLGADHRDTPGAGAAGGMGFAITAYLGGRLRSGIELVIEATGLRRELALADVVVTGEGRLDAQSAMGKAPVGVARLAKEHGRTVVAFSGCVTDEARVCNAAGIDAFFPILRRPSTLAEAMDPDAAYRNLADTAEQVFRLLACRFKSS
jgi:glycerate kinase